MLQDAIRAKDFEKAKEIINSTDHPFEGMQDYHITGIYDTLVREKAFEVIDALIEKGTIELDIYEYDSFNKTIFMSIIKNLDVTQQSISFLKDLISRTQSLNDELEGKSLLSLALEHEVSVEILKTLVESGCAIDIIDRSEGNLIHQIVKKYTRTYDKGLAYLHFLYEQGLDIDKPNIVQETPLHIAVKEHRNPYIKWLLENGADPNLQNKDGESPFFLAVSQGGNTEKYELMREFDTPDFDQVNVRGATVFGASDLNHLKLLLEDGADLYQTSTDTYGNEFSKIDDLARATAAHLQIALDSGQLEVDRKDDEGNTILHKICARETLHEEKRAKEVYGMVKLMLGAGADASLTNDADETPMMIAAKDNMKTKTVEILLNHK